MKYISDEMLRNQNQRIAGAIKALISQAGRSECHVYFSHMRDPSGVTTGTYKLLVYNDRKLSGSSELKLDFNPFDVNVAATREEICRLTGISSIESDGYESWKIIK